MAKMENYERTITTGLAVGGTAAVYSVSSDLVLNRTSLSPPAKGAATALVGFTGGMLLAGHMPKVAAGLITGALVNVAQSAARSYRLEARVDELLSQKRAEARQGAQQGAQQGNTAPGTGLPSGERAEYVNGQGQRQRAGARR